MTYAVVAPEHPLVDAADHAGAPRPRSTSCATRRRWRPRSSGPRRPKAGRRSTSGARSPGATSSNPFTGQPVPVYVADYVLMGYGTGAIMAVPAEDERDWAFAEAHGLPYRPHRPAARRVGRGRRRCVHRRRREDQQRLPRRPRHPDGQGKGDRVPRGRGARDAEGQLPAARLAGVTAALLGLPDTRRLLPRRTASSPVPEDQLPVLAPDDVEFEPTGQSPLASHEGFLHTTCPIAAGRPSARPTRWTPSSTRRGTSCASATRSARTCRSTRRPPGTGCRSTSTSAASSTPSSTCSTPASTRGPSSTSASLPACAREPFHRLFTQGMIRMDGTKMSKSKGNLVAPERYFETVGADGLRLFHLFVGPPADDFDWTEQTDQVIEGCGRFLDRLWRLRRVGRRRRAPRPATSPTTTGPSAGLCTGRSQQVSADIERWSYNTAVAHCMELVNVLQRYVRADDGGSAARLRVTARTATCSARPSMRCCSCSPRWPRTSPPNSGSSGTPTSRRVHAQRWPAFDPSLVARRDRHPRRPGQREGPGAPRGRPVDRRGGGPVARPRHRQGPRGAGRRRAEAGRRPAAAARQRRRLSRRRPRRVSS